MRLALLPAGVVVAACAAPPPKPPARQADRFVPTWVTHEFRDRDVLALSDDRVFLLRVSEEAALVHTLDASDGDRIGHPIRTEVWPSRLAVAGDVLVIASERTTIAAYARGAELWRADLPGYLVEGLAASVDYVLAVAGDRRNRFALCFDARTGRERWRQPIPIDWATALLAVDGGHGLVVARMNSIPVEPLQFDGEFGELELEPAGAPEPNPVATRGFELATGRAIWTHQGVSANAFAADPARLVIVDDQAVTVVDRASGLRREVALPAAVVAPKLALAHDVAFVAGPAQQDGFVIAVDLRLLRPRILARLSIMADSDVAVTSATVFVQTQAGTIVAIDRFVGALRWVWPAGIPLRLRASGDRLLVANDVGLRVFAPRR